ncbi:MAG: cyclic nucleotide-binding domain-containing protein, partial [Planifilum fulgidum]
MTALSARRFVDYFQPEQLKRLSSLMTPKRVQSGTNLFQDKEQADYLYFIHEGIVKIFNNTESGEEIALSLKYAGDMVGDPCTLP